MTEHEIRLAKALGACIFLPGHPHKRFCRNMCDIATYSPDKEISLRQHHLMEIMAWRYRRQMPDDLIPANKPLNLPPKLAEPKPQKPPKQQALMQCAVSTQGELPL